MPKLIIVQGPEREIQRERATIAVVNVFDTICKITNHTPTQCRSICLAVLLRYMDENWDVIIHDRFETNKDVSQHVMAADSRGYTIEFQQGEGEILSWKEAFAC